MSLLIKSGIPILKALDVASKTMENNLVKEELGLMMIDLRRGKSFSELLNDKVFPTMMIKMAAVGEETGTLEDMLNKTATFFESEISFVEERLISLVEPTIIVLMAMIIGVIVIAIMLPMMDIYNLY